MHADLVVGKGVSEVPFDDRVMLATKPQSRVIHQNAHLERTEYGATEYGTSVRTRIGTGRSGSQRLSHLRTFSGS